MDDAHKVLLFSCILVLIATTVSCYILESKSFQKASDTVIQKYEGMHHAKQISMPNKTGCKCINYDCGCCVYMDIPKIRLNDTGCVNLTYLPEDYGISLTFTIDKYVLLNETISARNPPPVCFGVPYLEKEVSLCLDFYDLDISKQAFSGCIQIEARLYHLFVRKIKVGCFRIPIAGTRDDHPQTFDDLQKWLDVIKVMRMKKIMAGELTD